MLGQIITKIFTGEIGIFLARQRVVAVLYVLMGIFAIALAGFLLGALFVWISSIYGPLTTSLGFAAGCLAIIVLLYIVLLVARRPPKQRASDRLQRDVASIASVAAFSNMPAIVRSVRRQKKLLLVPVAVAAVFGAVRLALGNRR